MSTIKPLYRILILVLRYPYESFLVLNVIAYFYAHSGLAHVKLPVLRNLRSPKVVLASAIYYNCLDETYIAFR